MNVISRYISILLFLALSKASFSVPLAAKDNLAHLDVASFAQRAKGNPGLILNFVNAKIEEHNIIALLDLIDLPHRFFQRVPYARQLLNPGLKKAIKFVAADQSDQWRWHKISSILTFRKKTGKILPETFAEALYYLTILEFEKHDEETLENELRGNEMHVSVYPEIIARLLDSPEIFFTSKTGLKIFLELLNKSDNEKIQSFAQEFYTEQGFGIRLLALVSKSLTKHYLKKSGLTNNQCDLFLGVSRHFQNEAVSESALRNTMYGPVYRF